MSRLDVLDTTGQRIQFKKDILMGKRVLHVKGFGGGFQEPSEDQKAIHDKQVKGAVAAISKFKPDFLVVDGDPFGKGFQCYIKAFADARRIAGEAPPHLIWAKNLFLDPSNEGRPKSEDERSKRQKQAKEWADEVQLPVIVYWIDNDQIGAMVDKLFGEGTFEKLKPEKFNKRGAVRILGQTPAPWVVSVDEKIKDAIRQIEEREELQFMEKCSFENAAKGNVIFQELDDAYLAAHGAVSFGGGESVMLEFATFYLNPASAFDPNYSALYPYSRGRDTDPALPQHVGLQFDPSSGRGGALWALNCCNQ